MTPGPDHESYFRARNAILGSHLPPQQKLLAVAILSHWPDMRPGLKRLAAMCSTSDRSVMRHIQHLEKAGVLRVDRTPGGPSHYHVTHDTALSVVTRLSPVTPVAGTRDTRGGGPVTPVAGTRDTALSPEEIRKEIRKEHLKSPRAQKRTSKQETTLPDDWAPTEQHRAYAAKHGIDLENEVYAFRGWAEGRAALSWNGRFATWLAEAVRRLSRNTGSPRRKASLQGDHGLTGYEALERQEASP